MLTMPMYVCMYDMFYFVSFFPAWCLWYRSPHLFAIWTFEFWTSHHYVHTYVHIPLCIWLPTRVAGRTGSVNKVILENQDRCYDFKNIFAEKFSEKIGVFWLKTKLNFEKYLIITLVFEKNAKFFAGNGQKSQKIMIITSTPGCTW
jgi:hypothetical protein